MTTLTNLILDLRTRFVDKEGRFLTDDDSKLYLNLAYREFVYKTEALRREYAFPVVGNQFMYPTPEDFVRPDTMMWMKDARRPLKFRQLSYFADNGALDLTRLGPPLYFSFHQGDSTATSGSQLRYWPIPNSDSEATSCTGLVSSSASIITTANASALRDRGVVLIDAEQVFYYAKSGNNLTQCVRGFGGTKAAGHTAISPVTQCDIHMWYHYQAKDLNLGGDTPTLPLPYHDLLVLGALYRAYMADGRLQEGQPAAAEWNQGVAFAKAELKKGQSSNFLNIQLPGGYD
jgi:hypothetical protein